MGPVVCGFLKMDGVSVTGLHWLEAKDLQSRDSPGTSWEGWRGHWGFFPSSPACHWPLGDNSDSHIWQIELNKCYAKEANPGSTTSCGWLGGVIAGAPREGSQEVGHEGCLGVPGAEGLTNCRGDKVQPQGNTHPHLLSPNSLLIIKVKIY